MAVIGTGLIGTSVALAAARQGVTVYLLDRDETAARTAAALGAGRCEPPPRPVDLCVLAVPPGQVATLVYEQQLRGLAHSYTDVASVKAEPEHGVLRRAPHPSRYVGGHPLAGRERSGPLAARADLFRGRPWALTPSTRTSEATVGRARTLVTLCGSVPVVMPSATHDEAVALISHTPHVVASLLAARMRGCPAEASTLAGQGLRDVVRIAGGDSALWSDILRANAAAVTEVLTGLHDDLSRLLAALRDLAEDGRPDHGRELWDVTDLLDRGVAGLDEIPPANPGHASDRSLCDVHVTIEERPGELPRLLGVVAEYGVQVEDAVAGADGDRLVMRFAVPSFVADALSARLVVDGWHAVSTTRRALTAGRSAPAPVPRTAP